MTLAQTIMCEQALGLVDRNTLLSLRDFGPNIPVLLNISTWRPCELSSNRGAVSKWSTLVTDRIDDR